MDKKTKVLLIDDSKTVRKTVAAALPTEQFSVTLAENGLEGIAAAFENKPDIILMDVMMPKIDGHTLCPIIRATPWGHDIKIVMLTGKENALDKAKNSTCGADGFIGKPFEKQSLIDMIHGFITEGATK